MIVNRNAWVAVDAAGVPQAVFPGREGARRKAVQWIREQGDRDDLRAVTLADLRAPKEAGVPRFGEAAA